jgi:RNA polymerase sigma-70 factor (ECF subfamily)
MEQFLASVERRAFTIARLAVGGRDDALDIVQDSMLALVKNYRRREASEWRPLFYTILNNRITDWHRRRQSLSRWQLLREKFAGDGDDDDVLEAGDFPDHKGEKPEQALFSARTLDAIDAAVQQLPLRQQQAFVLRCVEGFDVEETARIMSCSGGSVKAHLSRALHKLRDQLEDLR